MTWDSRVTAICVILTTLGALWGAVRSFQRSQREQARQIADEKQSVYNRGVVDGKLSRDDEVRHLTFERDDARADLVREREDHRSEVERVQAESDDWRRRYLDLQERRGP